MEKLFNNKVVLITGASSGIGRALAYEFAENGAHVILLARRFELISTIADELCLNFNKCIAIKCDVNKEEDVINATAQGIKVFKKIDIVIANAGFGMPGNFEDLTIADYKKQFETNVFGVLRTIYASLYELKKTKGNICIIGSVSGFVPYPMGSSAYMMSKFAIRNFAHILSIELSQYNISVTHVMPGFINTEFNKKSFVKKIKYLQMEPSVAAKLIVSAIKDKKGEVVLTKHGKLLVYLERYIPFLLRSLNKNFIKIKKIYVRT